MRHLYFRYTNLFIVSLCALFLIFTNLVGVAPAQSLLNAAYTNTQNSLAAKYVEASLKQAMASARDIQAAAELSSSGKAGNADFVTDLVIDLAMGGGPIVAKWVMREGTAFLVSKSGQILATSTDLSKVALKGIAEETAQRFYLALDTPMLIKDATTKNWISRSGLEFGSDPLFSNRIQHILEHLAPNINKKNHTVFDVKPNQLIPLLDEAWLTVNSLGIQPSVQGSRSLYNIPMARVVGTNGETSIRIVVEGGTSKIVTAFPVK